MSLQLSLIIFLVFIFSLILTNLYIKNIKNIKLYSFSTERGLHKDKVPQSGGIIFSLVFLLSIIYFFYFENLFDNKFFIFLFFGSLITVIYGLIDDIYNLSQKFKFIIQIILSFSIVYFNNEQLFINIPFINYYINFFFSTLFFVCLFNLINFIDGIDFILTLQSVIILSFLFMLIFFKDNNSYLLIVILLFLFSILGFGLHNFPIAKIFMGDSGSFFIGFFLSYIFMISKNTFDISIFTWLILLSYFITDTFITFIFRVFYYKTNFSKGHRDHAYQNFVFKHIYHRTFNNIFLLFNILWVLPLSILSLKYPSLLIFILILTYIPSIIFIFKYSPFFGKK